MTKPINEYTVDELSSKIEAIKAERERTANALKRYEEELERRKQKVHFGVPLESFYGGEFFGTYSYCFASKESERTFNGRLEDYVEALQKLTKGEPIDIQVLLPLLKKGWVAMYKDGTWCWYEEKPQIHRDPWNNNSFYILLSCFNIKPAENWEESLQECGL